MSVKTQEKNALRALDELRTALAERYPEGSRVAVMLSVRQKTPSPAEVVGYDVSGGYGYVRVRLLKEGRHGQRFVRDVAWQDVRDPSEVTP